MQARRDEPRNARVSLSSRTCFKIKTLFLYRLAPQSASVDINIVHYTVQNASREPYLASHEKLVSLDLAGATFESYYINFMTPSVWQL